MVTSPGCSRHRWRRSATSAAHLLADALVDQDVGVHRDADRQHDAGDAGQRQRRAEQRQHAEDERDVDRDRDVGEHAEKADRSAIMKRSTSDRADKRASLPGAIESAPRPGPTVRSSMTVELAPAARPSAAARTGRWRLHGEVAADLPGAAEDRLNDTGAEITLSSRTMAKGWPTFSCVAWRSCGRRRLEAEATIGRSCAGRSPAGRRSGRRPTP